MHRPGVGAPQPRDDRDEGGLAGAVRAQQAEDGARFESEVDARQRHVVAVALAHTPHRECWGYAGVREMLIALLHTGEYRVDSRVWQGPGPANMSFEPLTPE